jgi:hypothetical protein
LAYQNSEFLYAAKPTSHAQQEIASQAFQIDCSLLLAG